MTPDPLFEVDKLSVVSALVGFVAMIVALEVTEDPAVADGIQGANTSPPPEVIRLTGVVRDFHERTEEAGHPDFEREPDLSWGHYIMNVEPTLPEDGKPVFSGGGRKVADEWTDAEGRPICWCVPRQEDDHKGRAPSRSSGGVQSAETFAHWFDDVPGINVSDTLTLPLVRQSSGNYVFDDSLDPYFSERGGFFPIDEKLLGDSEGFPEHNFHFTFELHTSFTYDAGAQQMFRFVGDDDVFVYIDRRLVIDLGGVHSAIEQYVSLDRLGLEHGRSYPLDFFFAERHRTQSNFRVETNIALQSEPTPPVTAVYD